jgi:hypothetical protein
MGTQGVRRAKTGCLSQEGLEVAITKDVREPLPTLTAKYPLRWNLMAEVFSVAKASEPDDDTQTVVALRFRGPLRSPRDRRLGHHMGVAFCCGKLRGRVPLACG